ncbi:MAG: hypothetical protein IJM17_00155 [Firmicutes bacterium]|nr:hypothetical protein [Bacillota bacterium]
MSEKYGSYLKRILQVFFGIFLCGTGSYIVSRASAIGIGAWETLNVGIRAQFGIPFGTANIIVSCLVIAIDLICKGKIGIGSLINGICMGLFCNLWEFHINIVPETDSLALGIVYIIIAYVIQLIGTVYYMSAGLGCGPRDTLGLIVGYRFPKVKISITRFFLDFFALMAGVLLGAPLGLGTVAALTLRTFIMQIVFDLFKFDPRNVVHEDLIETFKNLQAD